MRRILLSALILSTWGLSAFGQNLNQKPLKEVLASVKSNTFIAVEGYYVDNSSFMVNRSSDVTIEENNRYPVYEYKFLLNLHNKSNNMTEVPILVGRSLQGQNRLRILFSNKKRSTRSQLVIEENTMPGISIVGDVAQYIHPSDGKVYKIALASLRDYLFGNGVMPYIEEDTSILD